MSSRPADRQAFPDEINAGMSVREYFIGQALTDILANCASNNDAKTATVAEWAIAQADEVLRQLYQRPQQED